MDTKELRDKVVKAYETIKSYDLATGKEREDIEIEDNFVWVIEKTQDRISKKKYTMESGFRVLYMRGCLDFRYEKVLDEVHS